MGTDVTSLGKRVAMKPMSCLLGACLLTIACGDTARRQRLLPDSAQSEPSELAVYSVSGRVSDVSGQPVISARVEVLAPGFEGRFVMVDPDGRYRVQNLIGGVRLEASGTGFVAASRGVTGLADAVVDFTLEPLPH